MTPKRSAATSSEHEADEFSAGGVLVRGEDVVVIVPRKRAPDGRSVLGLPKGHLDEGETAAQAAVREVREETGIDGDLVDELGEVHYRYQRNGRRIRKAVRFFLLRYRAGDTADHDHEVEEARWIPLAEARTRLSFPGERDMIERALSRLADTR